VDRLAEARVAETVVFKVIFLVSRSSNYLAGSNESNDKMAVDFMPYHCFVTTVLFQELQLRSPSSEGRSIC
jgi:hypothetical protein